MKQPFDPKASLVVVPVQLHGPNGVTVLRLALDTGATTTLVNPGPLVLLGCDPALAPERVQVTTGSGVEFTVRLTVVGITALGRTLKNFPLLCHSLPTGIAVDGLLGLDFLRGTRLAIDFRKGVLNLAA